MKIVDQSILDEIAAAKAIPSRSEIRRSDTGPTRAAGRPFLDQPNPLAPEHTRRDDVAQALDGIDEFMNGLRKKLADGDVKEIKNAMNQIKGWADVALGNLEGAP